MICIMALNPTIFLTTNFIQGILPQQTRVVRVMPNTPALICEGMSGIAKGSFATDEDIDFVDLNGVFY